MKFQRKILGLILGIAFSQVAIADSTSFKLTNNNEYQFNVVSNNKVILDFRQKVSFLDLENSDFEKLNTKTYYEYCNKPGGKEIEYQEGATGLVVVDEDAGLEQLNLSVQVNTNKSAGKCEKPNLENIDVTVGFPMIQTALKVKGSLGNNYIITVAIIQKDKNGNEIIPKVNTNFK